MKLIKKKLSDLKRPEKNLRLHPEKQIAEFKRSIKMFGQTRPIVIDDDGVMLCGNGLYEALYQLGYKEASCYVVAGLTEAEKKKLMLADNRIFDLGVDDMAAFDEFILELKGDLDIPGFDEDMLKSFVMDASEADALLSEYGRISDDRAEDIRDTRAKYDERDTEAAAGATELKPGEVPEDVRQTIGHSAPYKDGQPDRKYILCPECAVRIWL